MSQQPPNQLLTLPGLSGGDANDVSTATLPWWRRPRVIIGIAIALLIVLIGGLLLSFLNRKPPVTYQTQQVTQGDLSLTINATGPLQSSVYNLVFQGTGGKIIELDVKQGQKVTKGQILAKLDPTALKDALTTAQANLDSAKAALNTAITNAGASGNQYNVGLNVAKTAVGVNTNNQSQSVSVANANVASAQTTLDNAQSNLNSVQNTANTTKNQAQAQRQSDLNACEVAATTTNTSANASVATAQANVTTAQQALTKAQTANPTVQTDITAAEQNLKTAQAALSTAQNTASQQKSNAQTTLSACKQAANQKYNASVASADASIVTAQNSVNTSQSGLTQAQANANQTITTSNGQVTTSKAGVDTAAANTGAVTAEGQVATAQSNLEISVANLATAQHNLDNATLLAPHDGTVTTVNGTVGGTPGVPTSTGTTATTSGTFVQLVDLNSLQVQANVNESDTANLKVGDPAVFTVNAYGNRTFNGTVSGISPNGVTVSNVVTYPVTIDVDIKSAGGANLLPNMTANATITVVQRKNVPQISVNAVNFARLASSGSTGSNAPQLLTRQAANTATASARQMLGDLENQNPSVAADSPIPAFVIERPGGGDVFSAKPVVLGLTDGTNYEVLEGLSPGETYIVGTGSSTRTGTGAAASGG